MNLISRIDISRTFRRYIARLPTPLVVVGFVLLFFQINVVCQSDFEGQRIESIIVRTESGINAELPERLRTLVTDAVGQTFAAVRIRNALGMLHDTRTVGKVVVEAEPANGGVRLTFVVDLIPMVRRVSIRLDPADLVQVTEQELLLRTSVVKTGQPIDEADLRNSANNIVEYLRNRGFFRAEAEIVRESVPNSRDQAIVFSVRPGERATVRSFDVQIKGADLSGVEADVALTNGTPYSREDLLSSESTIRDALRDKGFLAPRLDEPRITFDSEVNAIDISVSGESGPTVKVEVAGDGVKIGESTQRRLLPVRRDGSIEYAALVEGERRLENHLQEQGYFFADVSVGCSVDPPILDYDGSPLTNRTPFICSSLGSTDLTGRTVSVQYSVRPDRRLKLVDIRIRGTELFNSEDISSVLESQTANILGIIPLFGYGRGYTSDRILQEDVATIRSLLRELGYRDAIVRPVLGTSIDGEELIVTFDVDEGKPTIIEAVDLIGNQTYSDAELRAILPPLQGQNFSIAKIRNGQRRLAEFYSSRGYFDASVTFSLDEIVTTEPSGDPRFRLTYTIQNEGTPVLIDRVMVSGNVRTKTSAILRALTFEPNDLLKAPDIYTSEQNLYSSDAFEQITIQPQSRRETVDGGRQTDVIVDVVEQAPRLLTYGGGFSTDLGLSGFIDLRHFNLFGRLWQGGARLRVSQRQQLAQIDFVNPRFIRDGKNRFAPLTITAQYQRDSTVTRFFRSAFDRGTFGIVQRLDEEGNPIDQFGESAGSPTLNRFIFTAETNRTINEKDRSILFVKYRFEDVRILNVESLLIRDLLLPDSRVRISGFGATFVRDTRKNCSIKYTILDIIARGEPGEPCRYSASDPTDGDYLTAEYNVSLPQLGANVGFNKFQMSYNFYRRFPALPGLRDSVFAARALIGIASVFKRTTDFPSEIFPDLENILPISERFFAGGSNTLRGFEFESAGPRVVIAPQGTFRNSDGEPVFLDPFTIPFGGNAIAVVNLETRIPLTESIRAVPFYDGGNVFRRASDIFKPPSVSEGDIFRTNLRARWTHTVGLGFRLKTPVGGEFGVDFGYLLNPPRFLVPQINAPNAVIQLKREQIHFRFSQAF